MMGPWQGPMHPVASASPDNQTRKGNRHDRSLPLLSSPRKTTLRPAMDQQLFDILKGLSVLQAAVFLLVLADLAFSVYGLVTIIRVQREIFQELRELRRH